MAKDMQYYYAQLRRIEEHREKSAEKEIRKVYKSMLTDLQHFISDEYVKLAEDGQLTYEILRGKNEYARFLDEVEKRVNGISPKVSKEIRATVNEMYKLSYDGMVDAVRKSTSSDALRAAFKGVKGATPEMIKAAVENPIAGLTLNDTLEKNRRDIIYNIKKQIGIGLTAGDRMSTMARRIADSLDGDYKKAVRVARTEVHRVRETGHNDCVEEIDQTLQNGTTSLRMVKIWRTMKDERVRPQQRVKTKHGWKTVIRGNADHMKMEGQTVLADELFDLGGGLKAKAPGQSGDASNDINCRCTVEYVLMSDAEYFKATGKHFESKIIKSASALPRTYENVKDYSDDYVKEHFLKKDETMPWSQPWSEQDVQMVQEKLTELIDSNSYSMRINARNIDSIIDGGFKSQFETNFSNGRLEFELRKNLTESLFGCDTSSFSASDFEKYGYLGSNDLLTDYRSTRAKNYGNTIVKFKKTSLADRVTYTIGDSMTNAGNSRMMGLDEKQHFRISAGIATSGKVNVAGIQVQTKDAVRSVCQNPMFDTMLKQNPDMFAQSCAGAEYVELQYHGKLTIDDIDTLCFTYDDIKEVSESTIKKLKGKGIKLFEIDSRGSLNEI